MSYSFTIDCLPESTPRQTFAQAGFADVECRESDAMDANWQEGLYHFYRPDHSCRVIEVSTSEDTFNVRLMAFSSADDYRLGLNLVEAVSSQSQCVVHSEDGEDLELEEFRQKHGEQWIEHMVRSPLGMLNGILRQGGTMTINGVRRPYVVGVDTLKELQQQADPDQFSARFYESLRQLQWLNTSSGFEASVMKLTLKDSDVTRLISSIGAPGLRYFISKVDYVAAHHNKDLLFIPWDMLSDALGDRFHRLHEELISIDPIEEDEWPASIEQIQKYAQPLS
ncbi:MAG: hypothetical protein KDA78_15235 [Planctomycetaceae bacterium]|nr:hypothetical protein [Planctomycetaceae bacterium]